MGPPFNGQLHLKGWRAKVVRHFRVHILRDDKRLESELDHFDLKPIKESTLAAPSLPAFCLHYPIQSVDSRKFSWHQHPFQNVTRPVTWLWKGLKLVLNDTHLSDSRLNQQDLFVFSKKKKIFYTWIGSGFWYSWLKSYCFFCLALRLLTREPCRIE